MEREALTFSVNTKRAILGALEHRTCSESENRLHTLLSESLALGRMLDSDVITSRQWRENHAAIHSEIRRLLQL
jgi:hypothetical protein